ncbi:hypothetical protein Taro_013770 [Colocasia esculenta]|uniref:Pectinesterase inhibitor domain-containing protein n=1 Tax=Colocasia esculenta TaxID=4460 RepID=A0A843UN39_COLES|nr:hypothetical protein [Colocasia esculenta]
MDRSHLLLLALALAFAPLLSSAASLRPVDVSFIRASCRSTRYPALCLQSLSGYATTVRRSSRQLAHAALAVTLTRAQSASAFVRAIRSPGRGAGAVQDCAQTVGDTVDQLQRSMKELGRMGRPGSPGFAWCLSNVQTWVSAALTDQTTCLDGLSRATRVDPRIRAAIQWKIVHLSQVTSNALALVNRIGANH